MARRAVASSHTAQEAGGNVEIEGRYNFSISSIGTGNTVQLQRSFDSGSNWHTIASYTAVGEYTGVEPENGMLYRYNVSVYSAGTVTCRISQ